MGCMGSAGNVILAYFAWSIQVMPDGFWRMPCRTNARGLAKPSGGLSLHGGAGGHGLPALAGSNKTALTVDIRHENGPGAGLVRTPDLQHLCRIDEAKSRLSFAEAFPQPLGHLAPIGACQIERGSFGSRSSASRKDGGRAENEWGGP